MSNILPDSFIFLCPHCNLTCFVKKEDINCQIFRHAVFKKDFKFVPPHSSKEECDRWVKEDLIYGCGKPLRFDGVKVSIIDYI